jgi:hypothetical protein
MEYENGKHVKRYFIQIENHYFLKFCSSWESQINLTS